MERERDLEDLWFHVDLLPWRMVISFFFNSSVLVILLPFTELIASLSLMAFKYSTFQHPDPLHVP